ncbi:xanthine/CO dehydrogenase XdhC/CoxF family maturation factor [Neolewinella xylanilytica]|uniref:Xanthine/CO dehydrogenase XdhC/CoxF family maturation factor n=1 Tax=Neolewinella xylanilytica TaxID=1514080 RepID=A0A2S6I576_9BACT|nr:XdhC family protein [Neolewinella xylanilytica]PPK86241.1 xanthine/CO dehydrogenase XdhC/CoxF family maturation factor [Neolewinella xylanilytica]
MKEIRNVIELYDSLRDSGTPCALATVVSIEGSSYRRIGARLIVGADGRYTGGISGGCLEGDALRRAQKAIHRGSPSRQVYDTLDGEDREIGIGLGCNGRIEVHFVPLDFTDPHNQVEVLRSVVHTREPRLLSQLVAVPDGEALTGELMEVPRYRVDLPLDRSTVMVERDARGRTWHRLYELIRPELHLIIVGDNYDIPPMATAARQLGWRCSVVGLRRKFSKAMAQAADRLYDYAEASELRVDRYTAVACMSHDLERDKEMVRLFLPQNPPYLGLLGPNKRAKRMDDELRAECGIQLLDFPNLYTPIGLDIGAETPEEIGACVVAEIISVFRERPGKSLKEKSGTIHLRN